MRKRIQIALSAACLAATAAAVAAQSRELSAIDEYRIGPEDVLFVSVWQNPNLTRNVSVRPDGKISLPLIRDVQAADLTPMELASTIEERLAEYMPAAQVSVTVTEVNSFAISIIGRVGSTGRYNLRSPTTVLEALAMAGGLQEFAKEKDIVVLRPIPFVGGTRTHTAFRRLYFDYDEVTRVGGETKNFALVPGDIILVP